MKQICLVFLLLTQSLSASEICSRVARINYQEVLVDIGNNKKGEGLRYYLEKDEVAKSLLDEYQQDNRPRTWSTVATTVGSLLIITGLFQTGGSDGLGNRETLMLSGAGIVGLNYLINKTISDSSEKKLQEAVHQYNKRNSPKIYFAPNANSGQVGLGVSFTQEF